jgi:hypothetical protein
LNYAQFIREDGNARPNELAWKKDYFSLFRVRFSPMPFTSQEAPQESPLGSTTR